MNPYLITPYILRETSEGVTRCAIQDELFKRREIQCFGEITRDSVYSMILQLRYLLMEDPEAEITMLINSPGGSVSDGLALYDLMKTARIRTVCVGLAASMGAILFISGNKRDILPNSKLLLHDPLIAGNGITGSALAIDSVSRNLLKTREITGKIIAEHSGHSLEEVYAITATDTYFDAPEAMAWGLADRIIDRI